MAGSRPAGAVTRRLARFMSARWGVVVLLGAAIAIGQVLPLAAAPELPTATPSGAISLASPVSESATPAPTSSPSPAATAAPTASPVRTPWPWPTTLPVNPPAAAFRVSPFPVVRLAPGERPYDANAAPDLAYQARYHDSTGVPMVLDHGRRVYKPAGLSQLGVNALNGYRTTGDQRYLAMAQNIGRALVRISRTWDGGLYIPYLLDFALHGDTTDLMHKPWYSAMGQGLALSLFTRLYQATGDPADLAVARKLFATLRHLRDGTGPWVAYVDRSRYLWLEEYPQPDPEHTLNGFIFASFGLYDYWLLTGDPTALQEYRGALTTLKAHVMRYRNPGRPAKYCLKHARPSLKYHYVVMTELQWTARASGDPYFARVARVLSKDA